MTEMLSPVPAPAAGAQAPGVSRAIYGMPMFATLTASQMIATVAWYTAGLGFIELFSVPGPGGLPVLVHLRRWQFQDLLVRPAAGPVAAGTSCMLSFAAVYDELDALADQAGAASGGRVESLTDTPWNTRDLTTVDPDGNRVIFTAPRPPELADRAFREWLDAQSRAQGLQPGRSQ